MLRTGAGLCIAALFLVVAVLPGECRRAHAKARRELPPGVRDWPPTDRHDTIPEQIHLAFGNAPNEMTVTWSTSRNTTGYVNYGFDPNRLTMTQNATVTQFSFGNPSGLQWIHKAKLPNLGFNTQYYYRVRSGNAMSTVFSFTTPPSGNDWVAKLLVFGDMGRHGGAQATESMIDQVRAGYPIAVIHAGDFAYDLQDAGGMTGDEFMNIIQPIATRVPYMTCIGNHENYYNQSHYINRFYMPGDSMNMWFSWNVANAHFIAYSTEVYFTNISWNGFDFTIDKQYQWLEQDLMQANKQRDQQPWIIAYGHRPFYCSNSDHDDCTNEVSVVRKGLEDLFYKYGVDLIIEAHEHSYERLWPTYNGKVFGNNYVNPAAPVHIITGAAGCNENDGNCINPIPGPRGPWSAFWASGNTTYGYAKLEVHNATHLYWEEILATQDDATLDAVWIVQNEHGPFASRRRH